MTDYQLTCGDGHGREVTFLACTPEQARDAREIERADDEGIIQADQMVSIFPGRPALHTACSMAGALQWAGLKGGK
jgi:hypothetical protein